MSENESENLEEQDSPVKIGIEYLSVLAVIRTTLIVAAVLVIAYLLLDVIESLGFLLFLIVIAIFLAYLLEPLVRLVRSPFESRQLEHLMPRPLAIVLSYIIVFSFRWLYDY